MAEDKYRVQRKPIESSEVSGESVQNDFDEGGNAPSQAANKAMLERIGQVHEQARQEVGDNYDQPQQPGLQVKGMENAPPMFREALKKS